MGLGIPPIKFKIMLESNPLKSRILVRRLAVNPTASKLATCLSCATHTHAHAQASLLNMLKQQMAAV